MNGETEATRRSGSGDTAAAAITFETLRAWRSKTARAAGVPAYRVFTDKQLHSLIDLRPRTREEFLSVPGVGEKTWDQFGPAFLQELSVAG